jgi:hypothetical protein
MSMRYKGGVISATAPTTSTSTAKGIWTTTQQMQAVGASVWPRSPGAPTIGTVTTSGFTASVPFTAPTDLGAGSVTYTATSSPGGFTGTSATSPITVSGLTNNTSFTFTVTATSPGGTGPASAASNSVLVSVEPRWLTKTAITVALNYDNRASNAAGIYQGNVAIGGTYKLSGYDKPALAFYNTSGALQWSKYLSFNSTSSGLIYSTFFDTSGNLYATGVASNISSGILYKFNSAGTQLADYKINVSEGFTSGTVDSSGNIYLVGTTGARLVVIKLNSSFVIQWQRGYTITGAQPSAQPRNITIDSSGNVYATFRWFADASDIVNEGFPTVIKYNSSGTFQWIRTVSGNDTFKYVQDAGGVTVDSSGNVYYIHTLRNVGFSLPVVTKFNSSGTWQFSKGNGGGNYGYSMAIDASDNIYFAQGQAVYRMTTAGVGVFGMSSNQELNNLSIDAGTGTGGSIYVGSYTDNGWLGYKLPTSSIVTGSYTLGTTTVVLSSTSNTLTDKVVTVSTPGFTDAATSNTISAVGTNFVDAGFTATTTSLN